MRVYTDNRKKHTALYRLQVLVSFALELSGFYKDCCNLWQRDDSGEPSDIKDLVILDVTRLSDRHGPDSTERRHGKK